MFYKTFQVTRVWKVFEDKKDTEVSVACQVSSNLSIRNEELQLISHSSETGLKGDTGLVGEQIQGPEGNKGYQGNDINMEGRKQMERRRSGILEISLRTFEKPSLISDFIIILRSPR